MFEKQPEKQQQTFGHFSATQNTDTFDFSHEGTADISF